MRPKSPRTELKISMTRILTNLQTESVWEFRTRGRSDVQAGVSSIGERSTATVDANRNTADQVASADQETRPEQSKASVVVAARSGSVRADRGHLCRKDNGHDDAVDGDDFAEDDGDQVLCSDSGGLDTTTEDGCAGDEDAPGGTDDRETDAEGDACASPCVGRDAEEEVADLRGVLDVCV